MRVSLDHPHWPTGTRGGCAALAQTWSSSFRSGIVDWCTSHYAAGENDVVAEVLGVRLRPGARADRDGRGPAPVVDLEHLAAGGRLRACSLSSRASSPRRNEAAMK